MDWFIVENGEAAGPFKESEIRRWLDSGKLTPETHATHEGVNEWKPLSELIPDEAVENLPPTFSVEEPSALSAMPAEKDVSESSDEAHDDQADLRRYQPAHEERIRSWAWTIVGAMYLLAFFGLPNYRMEWVW